MAAAAAGKATLLEMGGNGPIVVLADADLDRAVEGALLACFLCAGQSCTAGERLLVHAAVREDFASRLARAVRDRVRLGDPLDAATTMGPLNNAAVAAKMDDHVADAVRRGATVLTGGARATGFATDLYWLSHRPGRRAERTPRPPPRRRSGRSRRSWRSARWTRRSG
nr:hypothetical protein GCM10020092_063970 [Actinoplanes digitatis]